MKLKRIQTLIPLWLYGWLKTHKVSRSEFIRKAVYYYLAHLYHVKIKKNDKNIEFKIRKTIEF